MRREVDDYSCATPGAVVGIRAPRWQSFTQEIERVEGINASAETGRNS